jgi:very-short-patch-repair endonuclease
MTDVVKLDIEVDGDQHRDERGRQSRRDIVRDRILHADGWNVFRVAAWRCLYEPGVVVNEIIRYTVSLQAGATEIDVLKGHP